MMFRRTAALALLAGLISLGCNNASPSNNRTEEFSGVLPVNGLVWHNFTSGRNGEYSVRVTALTPNPAVLIGVYLGTPATAGCSQFSSITSAGLNTAAMTGALNKGSYCLGVVDPRTLAAATSYTIQLSHP